MRLDRCCKMPYKYLAMNFKTSLKDYSQLVLAHIRRNLKPWSAVAISVLLIASSAVLTYLHFLDSSPGTGKTAVIFEFPSGVTMSRISSDLAKNHVISSSLLFVLHARLEGADSDIKAGTYRFSDGMSPRQILKKLVDGDIYAFRFSVPEGYSIYQIAELLDKRGIFKKDSFLSKCFDSSLLAALGIRARSTEGYLYPSTYEIAPRMDEASLVRLMVTKFRSVYTNRYSKRAETERLTLSKLLTLASMIEKEAVVPQERPLIASVFINRLKLKMPLQSDPTAVYGLRAFAGKISRQDILRNTPYNTYMISGLPPGPIGNPGDGAIEAVLSPAKTDFLYFVAKKDGTHHFSSTLAEHNRAVELFLKTPHLSSSSSRSSSR